MQSFVVGKDFVPLEEVRSSLHTRKLHYKASSNTSIDNQAYGLVATSSKGRGNSGKIIFKKFENSTRTPKPNDICNYSKEKGHWKKKCPKKKSQENKFGSGRNSNFEDDLALVANEQKYCNDVWVLDSGTSYHMSLHREWFTTYEQVDGGNISMATSAICKSLEVLSTSGYMMVHSAL